MQWLSFYRHLIERAPILQFYFYNYLPLSPSKMHLLFESAFDVYF